MNRAHQISAAASPKNTEIWLTSLSAGVGIPAKKFRGDSACLGISILGFYQQIELICGVCFNWMSLVSLICVGSLEQVTSQFEIIFKGVSLQA